MLLDGDVLTMDAAGTSHVLDLQRLPTVSAVLESIRATLAGDRGALERCFIVEFAGIVGALALTLRPLDLNWRKSWRRFGSTARGISCSRVEIREPDGDRSLMTLRTPAAP